MSMTRASWSRPLALAILVALLAVQLGAMAFRWGESAFATVEIAFGFGDEVLPNLPPAVAVRDIAQARIPGSGAGRPVLIRQAVTGAGVDVAVERSHLYLTLAAPPGTAPTPLAEAICAELARASAELRRRRADDRNRNPREDLPFRCVTMDPDPVRQYPPRADEIMVLRSTIYPPRAGWFRIRPLDVLVVAVLLAALMVWRRDPQRASR